MSRIDKENYYLDIAETVLERSTCRQVRSGAIIVRNDEIVSTGYNGAPRGRANCIDLGYCTWERHKAPVSQSYELCRSVHAEANAIISAARSECMGGTMYLVSRDAVTGELLEHQGPCSVCRRMIINAGLSNGDPGFRRPVSGAPGAGLGLSGRHSPEPGRGCMTQQRVLFGYEKKRSAEAGRFFSA